MQYDVVIVGPGPAGPSAPSRAKPDGGRVVTASRDGTARLRRVLPSGQELIDHARRIVPRQLTPAERKWFFLGAE